MALRQVSGMLWRAFAVLTNHSHHLASPVILLSDLHSSPLLFILSCSLSLTIASVTSTLSFSRVCLSSCFISLFSISIYLSVYLSVCLSVFIYPSSVSFVPFTRSFSCHVHIIHFASFPAVINPLFSCSSASLSFTLLWFGSPFLSPHVLLFLPSAVPLHHVFSFKLTSFSFYFTSVTLSTSTTLALFSRVIPLIILFPFLDLPLFIYLY